MEHDRALEPAKPTLDGEPRYEALMADFYMRGANPALHFDDYDVRLAAYRALLAGAAGHTYGNNNIWQMWAPGRDPVLGANTPWNEAIDHPGAFQMGHVRRLFESRPWETLVPDQALLVGPNSPGDGFVRAAVASDRSFAFVYSPRGEPVSVDQTRLKALDLSAWWFDPRYGRAYFVHTGRGHRHPGLHPAVLGPRLRLGPRPRRRGEGLSAARRDTAVERATAPWCGSRCESRYAALPMARSSSPAPSGTGRARRGAPATPAP